ncbi:MAG: hypothetical protein Q8O41_04155 [Candidatus Methanoperedens sp.]|nr:hypothetical protein [Candidatus Methanoperedens sp.]
MIAIESKSGGRSETKSLRSIKEKYKPDKTIVSGRDILAESEGTINLPFVFISTLYD